MPDEFIDVPIETDPDLLMQQAIDRIQQVYPDWDPNPTALEYIDLQITAQQMADAKDVASNVFRSIFRYYGANLTDLPPIDATPAVGYSTWTMRDNAGYTIPAGALVGIPSSSGANDMVPFAVETDVIVPSGSTVTGAGAVQLTAVDPGADGTNLSGTPALVTALDFVTDIAITGPTTGGVDAETDDAYLNRLAAELALQSPRPILAKDFATLYRNIAGVYRATAIDNFIPAGAVNGGTGVNQVNVARAVYVVGTDVNGAALGSSMKSAGLAMLEADREVNFIVNVGDPVYKSIDVQFDAIAWPAFDAAVVRGGIIAQIEAFLDPALWGSAPGMSEVPLWYNTTLLKINDLVAQAYQVPGVRNVTSMQIAFTGNALAGADLDLSNGGADPVPLPLVGTASGTVESST